MVTYCFHNKHYFKQYKIALLKLAAHLTQIFNICMMKHDTTTTHTHTHTGNMYHKLDEKHNIPHTTPLSHKTYNTQTKETNFIQRIHYKHENKQKRQI